MWCYQGFVIRLDGVLHALNRDVRALCGASSVMRWDGGLVREGRVDCLACLAGAAIADR